MCILRLNIAAVIPVRNRPAVLLRALRSIQEQSYPVSEIVIVDDASTDETASLALLAAAEDDRIRVIQRGERGGASAARNIGWRASNADWVAFLDSDDEWMPEKLARQVRGIIGRTDVVASCTGYQIEDWCYRPPTNPTLFDLRRSHLLGPCSTAVVSRTALDAVGGFDEQLPSCQDWDLWTRLFAYGQIDIIIDPLVRFEEQGTNRITKNYEAVMAGHQIVFARMLEQTSGIIPRLRTRASHDARLSQIFLYDFERPLTAAFFAIKSGLRWPNGHALYLFLRSLGKLRGR